VHRHHDNGKRPPDSASSVAHGGVSREEIASSSENSSTARRNGCECDSADQVRLLSQGGVLLPACDYAEEGEDAFVHDLVYFNFNIRELTSDLYEIVEVRKGRRKRLPHSHKNICF